MKERNGNWTDLLVSHTLAADAKKIWLGLIAALGTIAVVAVIAYLYELLSVSAVPVARGNIILMLLGGQCATLVCRTLPLFNPFASGWLHFAFSALFYLLLMAVWTWYGSTITRLAALQYARDDIPTLEDALSMVRKKRKAYLFAPVTPLLGVFLFGLCNQLAGLIGSVPIVGPWILAVLIPVGVLPGTIILTFIAVLGVMSFGLMLPSISIGGKDAFEGWSSAYSYLLWGFNRFISYSALAAAIGLVSVAAVAGLSELFVFIMNRTVSIGLLGDTLIETALGDGIFRLSLLPAATGAIGLQAASWVAVIIAFFVRMLVPAYAFSYFFTANTIICFLMRKHVDRVDIDEVYYEEESVEEAETEEPVKEDSGESQPAEEDDTPAAGQDAEEAVEDGTETEESESPPAQQDAESEEPAEPAEEPEDREVNEEEGGMAEEEKEEEEDKGSEAGR